MIKIVADSGCDFTPAMKENDGINIAQVPLSLQVGDKNYVDDLSLDMPNLINELIAHPKGRKTAAPSPELYLEAYKGEESIFAITLSSFLSGSYNSAMLAKKMYLDEIGDKFIHVVDSFSASVGETLIALQINELSKKGLDDNEIMHSISDFVHNMKTFFILERYDNFVETGRLNPYVAKLASMLNIVPICGAENGKAVLVGQSRGQKRAFLKLTDMILKENIDFSQRVLAITHIANPEKALELKNTILKKINFKDVIITEGSGLCSVYADYNGLILAF